ncbi:guanylate kinase [Clostridia bacterium]|nr:guanylate kinase [Clostridia bacterium]
MSVRKGILLVISGPAGVGKGTLAEMLLRRDGGFAFSVSATTRAPRPAEKAGEHYYYLSEEEFAAMEQNGDFLETATVHGHRYGTPLKPVMQMLEEGRDLLLDIDSQGAASVLSKLADCVAVFILPPSFAEQERRLRARNTETEEELQRRLYNARGELAQIDKYRYAIVNDSLEEAFRKLTAIIQAERLNTVRYRPEIS